MPRPRKDDTTMLKWLQHPKCGNCGDDLILESAVVEDFPYIHCDIRMKCMSCGEVYLHGLPRLHNVGVAMHAMDTNLKDAMSYMDSLGERICRQCKIPMLQTKIWGDWTFKNEGIISLQWKCPKCYLTQQEIHNRKFPHGDGADLTEKESAALQDKLRRMGYID